jgi:type IV pilus assembly protein PilY1
LYAFDVSTPSSPLIKWRIGCPNADNDIDCTSGYADMGQSWSSLRPINASGYNDGITPLLIVGGGYDACHDNPNDQNTAICGSKGRKVYVIDAGNGSLVKAFNTDSSESGLIKYAYAADLGGNVYRISGATANSEIGATPPANWTITKIAAFGGAGVDNRKFMFAPDVLDEGGGNYVLLLGSGDREKPLTSYTTATMVNNRFYMIKDKPADSSWLASENFNCGADMICHASLVAITSNDTPTDTELKQKKGWYLALKSQEQVVTTAITVFGTVTFSTHQPTPPGGGKLWFQPGYGACL